MAEAIHAARLAHALPLMIAVMLLWPAAAGARQLDAIFSPGPLSRAHDDIKGLDRCTSCHEPGRGVTTERCLSCHKPIARRMAEKRGVHRAVVDGCPKCHAEHGGVDADLLRIDPVTFDHAAETGYALTDRHAPVARTCSSCHKTRSFLEARTDCVTCHEDRHAPTLGRNCARCHSTRTAFKETRSVFDHDTTKFVLTGLHRTVPCERCHRDGTFRGIEFDRCTTCHQAPHRRNLGPSCTTCHTTATWSTRTVNHELTAFALVGRHQQIECTRCHTRTITRPLPFGRCDSCHVNVHRDSITDDCGTCHTETGFATAKFDHAVRTDFPLVGKHVALGCAKCHTRLSGSDVPLADKVVDYGGTRPECATCHEDEHEGRYGRLCDACHQPSTFKTAGFVHPARPEFFGGRHTAVACVKCHVPAIETAVVPFSGPAARATPPAMTCRSCHQDVHLGQVGPACETCHTIEAARFAASRFSHDQAAFPLEGKHGSVQCAECHKVETGTYPAGPGTARRLKPLSSECLTCHQDEHLGQVGENCARCHTATTFAVETYDHSGLSSLFRGFHQRLPCETCHKKETGQFPAGRGTAVRFTLGKACATCHKQAGGGHPEVARLSAAHVVRGHPYEQ